ncbi:MAG TPA: hypothetical protein GXZ59_00930 [Clostridiaceae bacterium]|nr:hypothetical protein [Clostridiaceae bacterium]
MSKKNDSTWKTETTRAERKERLAKQKDSSGQKKQIKGYSVAGRIAGIIAAIVIIAALAFWLLTSTGLMQRFTTAAVIGDQKLSVADVNTVFGMQAVNPNMWNMGNVFTEQGQQMLDTELSFVDEEAENYRQLIRKSAIGEWHNSLSLYEEGKRNGFELSDEDQKTLENSLADLRLQIEESAESYNVSVPTLLKVTYGPGSRFEELENFYAISFYAALYMDDYKQSVEISESEMQELYEENENLYDMVDYKAVEFVAEYPQGTDETSQQQIENHTRIQAEKMQTDLESGKDFIESAIDNMENATIKESLTNEPHLFEHSFRTYNGISDFELRNWLFAEERETGDITILESTSGATSTPEVDEEEDGTEDSAAQTFKSFVVVQFEDRARQDVLPYTTRHILIRAEDGIDTPDAKLKTEAEAVLAEYNAGEKTEEAFGELAKEHSKDGNAQDGGIYEDISIGSFDEQYETWAMDPQRKEGDVGLVKSQFGYHVIYYVGAEGEEAWKTGTGARILDQHIEEWRGELINDIPVSVKKFGHGMVGKFGFLKILFG